MEEREITLADIRVGESMTVRSASGEAALRFFDLGFFRGANVRCLGRAPLGDPLMLSVGGRVIAVRKRNLKSIIAIK